MSPRKIALITEDRYVHPPAGIIYSDNILLEDALLSAALQPYEVETVRVSWSDPEFDWSSVEMAVFRTTWNYFHQIDAFLAWLKLVSAKTQVLNPYATVIRNMDKHYLADLSALGIPVVETHYVERGDGRLLEEIMRELPYAKCIVKPCIAGAARHTYLTTGSECAALNKVFAALNTEEAYMIQPFYESVLTEGECTYVVIGGKFTHAVRKQAKQGDFRVQDDFGGTVHAHTASVDEITFAEKVMRSIDPLPAYGRVDVLRAADGTLCVSELELIEPELWMRFHPESANLFAEEIYKHLECVSK